MTTMDRTTTPPDCAWVCDSPVSYDEAPSMSKSSLPRCAVVNFRRDGDQVHVTPRAYRNNGGMACRVLKFEDAFQLEELSSRTFAFSKPNRHQYFDNDSCFDVSAALSAVADMTDRQAPTTSSKPSSRKSSWARRLSSVLRRTTFDSNRSRRDRESNVFNQNHNRRNTPPHPWRSQSLGCVPTGRDVRPSNASSVRTTSKRRGVWRRRTARHEMQLFENGTVLAEPPKGRREWRFRRFRKCRELPPPAPCKPRASIDSYVLYMDDEL